MPYLSLASPPSPELDLEPKLFIASAKVSCAFGERAPKLIPAESNLFKIFLLDSTFVNCVVFFENFIPRISLSIAGGLLSTRSAYS